MKATKFATAVLVASVMLATVAEAGSIGRSGGGSFGGGGRSSSSFSSGSSVSKSSSFSQPSKPAVAPAPATAHPGGIGGNTASVGVRKSDVTGPVSNSVNAGKPGSFGSTGSTGSYTPHYTPTPSYGYSAPPQPTIVNSGGGFGSSFMGSLGGTLLGNALFGNHGHGGGTTVINNGTPSGGTVNSGVVAQGPSSGFDNGPGGSFSQPVKKEYTMWNFIGDVITFAILIAVLVGLAWLFYKGFQMVRGYINKERGVSNQPFNPTQQFWEIQRAFGSADVAKLQTLLGPDVVDELTNNLQPSTVTLHNVSHEVRLNNNTEFSVWYKFEDEGQNINQVWHYEKFGKDWKLNGIENV